jgi:hypothetical protein
MPGDVEEADFSPRLAPPRLARIVFLLIKARYCLPVHRGRACMRVSSVLFRARGVRQIVKHPEAPIGV